MSVWAVRVLYRVRLVAWDMNTTAEPSTHDRFAGSPRLARRRSGRAAYLCAVLAIPHDDVPPRHRVDSPNGGLTPSLKRDDSSVRAEAGSLAVTREGVRSGSDAFLRYQPGDGRARTLGSTSLR